MAWDNEMRIMLRVLIDDTDIDNLSFTDSRLDSVLVVSARYVIQDVDLPTNYTINIVSPDISPDPTTSHSSSDLIFMNLAIMKSACFIDQGTFRTKAAIAGVRAKCGPVLMETLNHMAGFKELLTLGPCAAYDALKLEYSMGNLQACQIVLSPFSHNDFIAQQLPGSHHHGHHHH